MPLGWLDCLFGMCSGKTETLAVVRDFTIFLLECRTALKLFALSFYTNFLFFLNFSEFLEYQKYGECSDDYRLSCLRQIMFLMHCFACFDETIDSISGISHEKKLYYSSYNEKIKYKLVCNST